MSKIAIIGAGAAGFFAAMSAKEFNPDAEVFIFEKSSKVLAKVRVSGGGRCNVTHSCFDVPLLVKNYPRGEKELKGPFHAFNCTDTVNWFEARGVKLKTESDGRMFPATDSSETIIQCFLQQAEDSNIHIELNRAVLYIKSAHDEKIEIGFSDGTSTVMDAVIVTTGGSPTVKGFDWLSTLGHTIVPPVPSLFTFNIPFKTLNDLMGSSVAKVKVSIITTRWMNEGSMLITHWGLSGPAVLKLSSLAARYLAEVNYDFEIQVGWLDKKEDELRAHFAELRKSASQKLLINSCPPELSKRLWEYLINRAEADGQIRMGDLPNLNINKLVNFLLYDRYPVKGKTTFKEEFVTSGGVSLKEINFKKMESKLVKNLFFAGEVLDIDAVTGGFNFQAAWTTGYLAGKSAAGA